MKHHVCGNLHLCTALFIIPVTTVMKIAGGGRMCPVHPIHLGVIPVKRKVTFLVTAPFPPPAGRAHSQLPARRIQGESKKVGSVKDSKVTPINDRIKVGRPLVSLKVNGVMCTCFVDTGSEVTLMKQEMKAQMNIKSVRPSSRTLRGASGHSFRAVESVSLSFFLSEEVKCKHEVNIVSEEVRFPGDILLGMDLLRRFNFRMVSFHSPQRSYISLNGVRVRMTYSDTASLNIKLLHERRMPKRFSDIEGTTPVFCLETLVCPPEMGRFVPGVVFDKSRMDAIVTGKTAQVLIPRSLTQVSEGQVSIWVVNDRKFPVILQQGAHIASLESIDQVFESTRGDFYDSGFGNDFSNECHDTDSHFSDRFTGFSNRFNNLVSNFGDGFNSNVLDFKDSWFHDFTDSFDAQHGTGDFGYDADDFDVFPQVSTDVLTISTPSGESVIQAAKLDHLGSFRRDQLMAILQRHAILFDESAPLGKVPYIKHRIPTADSDPIRTRQWRLPESARATIRDECDEMLREGVISPSTSPWLSPVVLVKKKDGGIRFCVDYRKLNRVTTADAYPMPRIDQMIDELSG
ncbi:uncharacterized protein LOC119576182 [Penaeus monodon]|uniref:uncharacterized protein LOC119576182 n=1 Tax=Penaeus monodon TaxID=6687 RepID=UPI0018A7C442|nr:uncharacterized protein LOC119576182 [Penaeus monodon]